MVVACQGAAVLASADISVYPNLTFDLSQRMCSRDDFWLYRYYLTVAVRPGHSRAVVIALVSQLHESDLPRGGGYQA
jgi:hypothetical protein